uniref:DUF148 domain-containing protein n=1 Tax=Haemonchus contortus TaxID=6289 RepID=A0A7I5EA47_HAECO|nr:Protein of unknown function DUF148 domain containing protein [Haemonchus contortus]
MNVVIVVLAFASIAVSRPSRTVDLPGRGYPCTGVLPAPPPYLRNLTEEARSEYLAIISNRTETIAQQKEDILTWAQKYEIEDEVQEFESNMNDMQDEVRQNVTDLIGQLSEVLDEYSSIIDDEDQTREERRSALRNLTDQYPEAYPVLALAFSQFRPERFGDGDNNPAGGPWESPQDDFDGPPPPPPPGGDGPDWSGESDPCDSPPLLGVRIPCGRSSPPYLRNLTEDARSEYLAIISTRTSTIAQQKENILRWAQNYGIEDEVQEYESNMNDMQNEIRQNVTDLINQLSDVLEQYSSIIDDEDQTRSERRSALRNLSFEYPEAYPVLVFAFSQFTPEQQDDSDGRPDWSGEFDLCNPPPPPGPRNPCGPPLPPYLRNLTEEARDEYLAIISNRTETIAQQKEDILTWAQKYGIEDEVQEFESNMNDMQNEIRQNVSDLISQLSEVLEQYSSIIDDEDQTRTERRSALRNLTDQYPEAYPVLAFAFSQFRPGPFGGDDNNPNGSLGESPQNDFNGPPPPPGGGGLNWSGESNPWDFLPPPPGSGNPCGRPPPQGPQNHCPPPPGPFDPCGPPRPGGNLMGPWDPPPPPPPGSFNPCGPPRPGGDLMGPWDPPPPPPETGSGDDEWED